MSDENTFMNMGDEPNISQEASLFPTFNKAFDEEMGGSNATTNNEDRPSKTENELVFVPITEIEVEEDKDLGDLDLADFANELTNILSANDVHLQMRENGGVTAKNVYTIEQFYPNCITQKKHLRMFSNVISNNGYEIALEGVSENVARGIKKIVEMVIRGIKTLYEFGVSLLRKRSEELDFTDIKSKYDEILSAGQKADSLRGINSFKEKYGNTPAGKKSSSCKHFVAIYTANKLSEQFKSRFVKGWRDIQTGAFNAEVSFLLQQLTANTKEIENLVLKLEQGGDIAPTPIASVIKEIPLDQKGNIIQDEFKTNLSHLIHEAKGEAKPYTVDPINVIGIANPFTDKLDVITNTEKALNQAQSKLEKLQKQSTFANPNNVKVTATSLEMVLKKIRYSNAIVKLLKQHTNVLTSYHNAVGSTIYHCLKVAHSLD